MACFLPSAYFLIGVLRIAGGEFFALLFAEEHEDVRWTWCSLHIIPP
jgi:hypothetical protein